MAGANSWSSDGTWIYFTTGGDNGSIWRANVALGRARTDLTRGFATAVAASPDDTLISWIVRVPSAVGWDLYVANSDGTDPRLLLANALNCGWSATVDTCSPGGLPLKAPAVSRWYRRMGPKRGSLSRPTRAVWIPTRSATSAGDNPGPERTVQLPRNDR